MNYDKVQGWNGYQEYPHLVIVIFLEKVVKIKFLLICLDRYLFSVVSSKRYLPKGSKENALSITITKNVTMFR